MSYRYRKSESGTLILETFSYLDKSKILYKIELKEKRDHILYEYKGLNGRKGGNTEITASLTVLEKKIVAMYLLKALAAGKKVTSVNYAQILVSSLGSP